MTAGTVTTGDEPASGERLAPFLLALLGLLAGLASFRHQVALLDNLHTGARDLAFFTQSWWNATHGGGLRTTIGQRGAHLFSEHAYLAHALLVPLYWLFPTPRTLFALGAAAVAVTPLAAYRLARGRGVAPPIAALLGLLVFSHPQTHGGAVGLNYYGFHPDVLFPPLFLLAEDARARGRRRLQVALALASVLVLEQGALAWVGVGAVRFLRGERREGALVAGVALAWFVFAAAVFIPAHSSGLAPWYVDRKPPSPERWLPALGRTAGYAAILSLGLAGLPFLSPLSLGVLPLLAVYCFAWAGRYTLPLEPLSWHGCQVLPVLVLGAADALARLAPRLETPRRRAAALAAAGLVAAFALDLTVEAVYDLPAEPLDPPRRQALARVEAMVPKEPPVAASFFLLSRFAERRDAVIFPCRNPDEFAWILVDLRPRSTTLYQEGRGFELELEQLRANPRFELVLDEEGFLVFRRT